MSDSTGHQSVAQFTSLTFKNWVTPKDGAKPDLFDPTNRPWVGVTKTAVMIVMNFVILFGCFSQQTSLKVKYNAWSENKKVEDTSLSSLMLIFATSNRL